MDQTQKLNLGGPTEHNLISGHGSSGRGCLAIVHLGDFVVATGGRDFKEHAEVAIG